MQTIFTGADILLPKEHLREKFAVVACDQYTGEPEYWQEVSTLVDNAPSALHMILPEYLIGKPEAVPVIYRASRNMRAYLSGSVFDELQNSFIYLERTLQNGNVRPGLCGKLDLLTYDFNQGSQSPVRASEATVLERIPPRVKVRENAMLESPHIMVLLDDPEDRLISAAKAIAAGKRPLYAFPLMMNSGSLRGYQIADADAAPIHEALDALFDPAAQRSRYGTDNAPMFLAIGDGNHSLATAKECYRALCEKHGTEAMLNHPARWALVELVNLHDPSLEFEPIHRLMLNVDRDHLLSTMKEQLEGPGAQRIGILRDGYLAPMTFANPTSNMAVGSLQAFLDHYIEQFGGTCDYIHGDDVTARLTKNEKSLGFLLPPIEKSALFPTVYHEGALTRKTFSMGHACDKRFYLECRSIVE